MGVYGVGVVKVLVKVAFYCDFWIFRKVFGVQVLCGLVLFVYVNGWVFVVIYISDVVVAIDKFWLADQYRVDSSYGGFIIISDGNGVLVGGEFFNVFGVFFIVLKEGVGVCVFVD